MTVAADKVAKFWSWFAANAPLFGEAFENEALLQRLDDLVTELGDFAWEVGPGERAPFAFVISPGGDRALLNDTRAIVAAAPTMPNWELHYAKPPKVWELCFGLQDEEGQSLTVDASNWRCALLVHPDGCREVVVEGANISDLSEEYQRWAGEILLDGLLGEARRLESVDIVRVVEQLAPREQEKSFPVSEVVQRI